MIGQLHGLVSPLDEATVLVDVHGVGFEVRASLRDIVFWQGLEGPVRIFVETEVRQDAITLFGFRDLRDRTLFRKLRAVDGIGPTTALGALHVLETDTLLQAVEQNDLQTLMRIPKVGKKLASRLVLELQGKLEGLGPAGTPRPAAPTTSEPDLLDLALGKLGYNRTEIERARAGLEAEAISDDTPLAERVRHALRILSSK